MPRDRTPPQPDDPRAVTGAVLERLRELRGLSKEEVARRLGLASYRAIWEYETGRRAPRLDELPRIAAALEVNPGELGRRIAEAQARAKKADGA